MEVNVTNQGTLEILLDKWDLVLNLIALGFTIAVVVAVVAAGFKLGARFWPWVLGASLLVWILL